MVYTELTNTMNVDPQVDDSNKDSIDYQILHNMIKGTYHAFIVMNTDGTTTNDRITEFAIGMTYYDSLDADFVTDKDPELTAVRPAFIKSDVIAHVKNGIVSLSKSINGKDKYSNLMIISNSFYKEGLPMMPDGDYPVYCMKNEKGHSIIVEIRHEVEPDEDIEIKEANVGQIEIEDDCYVSDPTYNVDTWCNYHLKNMVPGKYDCYCKMVDTKYGRRVGQLRISQVDFITPTDSDYIDLDNEHIGVDSGTCGFSISKPLNDGALLGHSVNSFIWNKIDQSKYGCCVDKRYGVFSNSGFGDGDYLLSVAKAKDTENKGKVYAAKVNYMQLNYPD